MTRRLVGICPPRRSAFTLIELLVVPKDRDSRKKRAWNGFTLIELLVVIAIIAILASILFPVFARARDKARQSACLSNAKNIGMGLNMYVQDYNENFFFQIDPFEQIDVGAGPNGGPYWTYIRWPFAIQPYIKNTQVFQCLSDARPAGNFVAADCPTRGSCGGNTLPWRASYGANLAIFHYSSSFGGNTACPLSRIDRPAQKVAIAEAWTPYGFENWNVEYMRCANFRAGANSWVSAGNAWRTPCGQGLQLNVTDKEFEPVTRHTLGNVIIFTDGHAKWFRWNRIGDSRSCEWIEATQPEYMMNPPQTGFGCTIRNQPRI